MGPVLEGRGHGLESGRAGGVEGHGLGGHDVFLFRGGREGEWDVSDEEKVEVCVVGVGGREKSEREREREGEDF